MVLTMTVWDEVDMDRDPQISLPPAHHIPHSHLPHEPKMPTWNMKPVVSIRYTAHLSLTLNHVIMLMMQVDFNDLTISDEHIWHLHT